MSNHKVALITGSAKRIGAYLAQYLHQRQYDIILHYRNSAEDAKALRDQLNQARPHSCIALHADLCDPNAWQQLAQQTQAWQQRLDLLVNNSSSFYPTPLGSITLEHWHDLFASNAQAPLFLTQHLYPLLQQTQGNVINIVDALALKPNPDFIPYSMAKSALITQTRALAKALAPAVRVNAISPGAMLWPEGDHSLSQQQKQKVLEGIPMGRPGGAEDIARTVYFLAEDAPYITGQDIAVDGGRSLN
jgi:pteridine reductase